MKPYQDILHRLQNKLTLSEVDINDAIKEILKLRKQNDDYHWRINPDRMGGAFTEDEIRDANTWK